jgi:hypothetical protein
MSLFPGTRVHNVRPTSNPHYAWRWLTRFQEKPLTRRWHFGSTVGCIAGFFDSRSNEYNVAPRNEGILDFMNINNMSLGTLNPLHVYVKHDVELIEGDCGSRERRHPPLYSYKILRMPSTVSNSARVEPQQERATRRLANFLDVAAVLFEEIGYEATTMTAIAERSGSGIERKRIMIRRGHRSANTGTAGFDRSPRKYPIEWIGMKTTSIRMCQPSRMRRTLNATS